MSILESLLQEVAGSTIARGDVVRVEGTRVTVASGEEYLLEMECQVLQSAEGGPLRLSPGDAVLVWRATEDGQHGIILGRLGPSHASEPQTTGRSLSIDPPDELILEAKHSLTLRVGDGSITIREDGKILIKGKDLVSHAQRLNRIKGGAVQIN